MERSYRIKANIGKDQVLNVNLKRDVDLYEVLSLKLSQEKLYKLHSSNYGVIVGRVLANDGFGVPNAKVSVFIPISKSDNLRSDIKEIYPYAYVTSFNKNNIRFNTLPDYQTKDCYKPVGTFPSKRMVLDEDIQLEIQDKYYKYTTITNNAGDYMIFGVPIGKQEIHVDIDLSDIGVLSQRPTDFIYKGYSINMFESPVEFKKSTNLSELPQLISENSTVNVYPLWGDKDENEIAITRKDVRIQYKFEPTCIFLGSVMTDSSVNNIAHDCTPGVKMGEASQLVPSDGTIEMIRKRPDDVIEEFNIKGNQLIDGDGVWCYQIPMNLDYVCTDEYGNIVPTDNPNKGIPTRARVRFRVTLNEIGNEAVSSHKARYLIPNNPDLKNDEIRPMVDKNVFDNEASHYYEFGTLTNDDCFRDLLWNKVYSVKSYIPRIQRPFGPVGEKTDEYLAIKGVNKHGADEINPIPYNKLNLNFSLPFHKVIDEMWEGGNYWDTFREFWYFLRGKMNFNTDHLFEKMVDEMDGVGLDFYNDWLNGCLYFPNWHWYMKNKKSYSGARNRYDSKFCDCDNPVNENDDSNKLCVLNNCSLVYKSNDLVLDPNYTKPKDFFYSFNKMVYGSKQFENGIIKKIINKDNAELYYYSFGQACSEEGGNDEEHVRYVRLFSTDIILLGSLNDCDIHGIPKISSSLPSTTSTIPPMGAYKEIGNDNRDDVESEDSDAFSSSHNSNAVNGMNWGQYWLDGEDLCSDDYKSTSYYYKSKLSTGLFFGLTKIKISVLSMFGYRYCSNTSIFFERFKRLFKDVERNFIMPLTHYKTCVNAERICELGVTNDSDVKYQTNDGKNVHITMDGIITRKELQEIDTRAEFATLNSNKLIVNNESDTTGYKSYYMYYSYPTNFDGRLSNFAKNFKSLDIRSKDYLDFKFGSVSNLLTTTLNYTYGGITLGGTRGGSFSGYRGDENTRLFKQTFETDSSKRHFYGDDNGGEELTNVFPLYNNSFYFYFGLNPAHTAIGEFYKNFMTECTTLPNNIAFSVELSVKASDWCGSNGSISVSVNGAAMPYSIVLTNYNNDVVSSKTDIEVSNMVIENLENGSYTLTVIDNEGKSVSNTVILSQRPISLEFKTLTNDGRLELNRILNNGRYWPGSGVGHVPIYNNKVTCHSDEGLPIDIIIKSEEGTTGQKIDATITIESTRGNGESMCVFYNDNTGEVEYDGFIDMKTHEDGSNILHFRKPSYVTDNIRTFKYKIVDNTCPDENYSEGTFDIILNNV